MHRTSLSLVLLILFVVGCPPGGQDDDDATSDDDDATADDDDATADDDDAVGDPCPEPVVVCAPDCVWDLDTNTAPLVGELEWNNQELLEGTVRIGFTDSVNGREYWLDLDDSDVDDEYDIDIYPGTYDVWFDWIEFAPAFNNLWQDPITGRHTLATGFTVPAEGAELDIDLSPPRITGSLTMTGQTPSWVNFVFTDPASGQVHRVDRLWDDIDEGFDIPMYEGTWDVCLEFAGETLGCVPVVQAHVHGATGSTFDAAVDRGRIDLQPSWNGGVPEDLPNAQRFRLTFTDPVSEEVYWTESGGLGLQSFVDSHVGTWDVQFEWLETHFGSIEWMDAVHGPLPIATGFTVAPGVDNPLPIVVDTPTISGAFTWDGAAITNTRWRLWLVDPTSGSERWVERHHLGGGTTYESPALEGTHDVYVEFLEPRSPGLGGHGIPQGRILVGQGVAIPASGMTLDIALAAPHVTGLLTWNGEEIEDAGNSEFELVFTDPATGAEYASFLNADDAEGQYDIQMFEGTYDVFFRRTQAPIAEQVLWGDILVAEEVTVTASGATLDIVMAPSELSGTMSIANLASAPSGVRWQLRLTDSETGEVHWTSRTGDDPGSAYSLLALPGVYELDFLWESRSNYDATRVIYGAASVGSCLLIE